MSRKWIDLHTHSTASDGTDSPSELVHKAAAADLCFMALTDHDTMAGIPEAFAVAQNLNIGFIQGIELGTEYEGKELHILGYGVQLTPDFEAFLNTMVKAREERNLSIISKLNQLGFAITMDDVLQRCQDTTIVSRPHIALTMYEMNLVQSRRDAWALYLGEGKPAFATKKAPHYGECFQAIRKAGGVPVIAHPYLLEKSKEKSLRLFQELKNAGLEGIEVWHSEHPFEMQDFYYQCSKDFNLLATGGSDYHGSNKQNIHLASGFENNVNLSDLQIVEILLDQIQKNQKL